MGSGGEGKEGVAIRRLFASKIALLELHPPSFGLPSVAFAFHVGLDFLTDLRGHIGGLLRTCLLSYRQTRRREGCPIVMDAMAARRGAGEQS